MDESLSLLIDEWESLTEMQRWEIFLLASLAWLREACRLVRRNRKWKVAWIGPPRVIGR